MLCHKRCKETELRNKQGLSALSLLLGICGNKNSCAHQTCCQVFLNMYLEWRWGEMKRSVTFVCIQGSAAETAAPE